MTNLPKPNLDDIWTGDLFERREEALLLIDYIESVYCRPVLREDAKAFTLAVDAGYGAGKSFFLKRLAQTLALSHPVAFVDAWADDLADEPLVALSSTLKDALRPYLRSAAVATSWKRFLNKSGTVAKIAGIGILKRGAGFVITHAAAEAAHAAIDAISNDSREKVKSEIDEGADDIIDKVGDSLMEKQIEEFNKGRIAVQKLKDSISAIIASIPQQDSKPPIVIIIDELDRCRPTYAIKTFEEIKHLFDVNGLVFIFGMNREQLAHSVSNAYGMEFDGRAYLKRFIHRVYNLKTISLTPLLSNLLNRARISDQNISFGHATFIGQHQNNIPMADIVAEYMKIYGLKPRDAFELVDRLQTCIALANSQPIYGPYVIPAIIADMEDKGDELTLKPKHPTNLKFMYYSSNWATRSSVDEFKTFRDTLSCSDRDLSNVMNNAYNNIIVEYVFRMRFQHKSQMLSTLEGYKQLLSAVARFENPERDP